MRADYADQDEWCFFSELYEKTELFCRSVNPDKTIPF